MSEKKAKKKIRKQGAEQAVIPTFMQQVVTNARQALDSRPEDERAKDEERALIDLAQSEGWIILRSRIEEQIGNIKTLVDGAGWDLEELGLRHLLAREIEYALLGVIESAEADLHAREEQVRAEDETEDDDPTDEE